ncbi:chromate transporter [Plastorhodobacter daqingensis]|uniref:Chromate transporter n=1 Tax=Plastorhodobacter daqingensis TaxID=1387281 RepID=A0ABW2UL03_9RHOB
MTAVPDPRDAAAPLDRRGIAAPALFRCFGVIGLLGFGGVLPVAMHELMERRRWLSAPEFTEILSLCQVLPGPNIVNFSVIFGMRCAGMAGALAAVTGLMGAPVVIVLALGALYAGFADLPVVQDVVRPVAAAAAGLVCAVAARLFFPVRRQWRALVIIAAVVLAVAVLRLPLIWVLPVLAPLGIALMAGAGRAG